MDFLIYNNNGIEITTDGTSKFMYADNENEVYGEYDYTEIEEFMYTIQYLPQDVQIDALSYLDNYYFEEPEHIQKVEFDCSSISPSTFNIFLRECNELAIRYGVSYKSQK